ncbi:hypothetical protein V6N12_011205 [Hibiscus sabdariffa]|uniref:Uncharacterized protein n=1 Tax=Hibiscus sabdariffa TaxID=183260 RepID=A0ABR2EP39_9ROSI
MQPDLFNKTPVLITVANGKGARPVKPVHYSHDQLILSCTASIACVCVIVAVFGAANALVQGGMIGDLSFMLPVFLQSFLTGLAAAGTLTSGLRLVTKEALERSENGVRIGAMKYFHAKAALEGSKTVLGDLAAAGIETRKDPHEDSVKQVERLSNKQLFYQHIDYALDLFLIYALTLSIFPGFLYENTGEHRLGTWYPLVLVAVFNIWDLVSRYFPLVKLLKIESRKWLMIATFYCFLLVPASYFTAKYGDQGWMILLVSVLGLINGHLTVCVLIAAPRGYMIFFSSYILNLSCCKSFTISRCNSQLLEAKCME